MEGRIDSLKVSVMVVRSGLNGIMEREVEDYDNHGRGDELS